MIDTKKKEFIKHLYDMAGSRFVVDVFGDVVGMFAASLEKPFTNHAEECETRYMSLVGNYTKAEAAHLTVLLGILVQSLEEKRESFLGPVLEEIGASNTRNGQFLTPASIANVCGRICAGGIDHKPGEVVKVSDPACGCGVLLISQGEEMLKAGIPQRDIFLVGGDIDLRGCDSTFVELTLLGYAARIDHQNAMTMQDISRPRFTPGFYLHGTQWRLK